MALTASFGPTTLVAGLVKTMGAVGTASLPVESKPLPWNSAAWAE